MARKATGESPEARERRLAHLRANNKRYYERHKLEPEFIARRDKNRIRYYNQMKKQRKVDIYAKLCKLVEDNPSDINNILRLLVDGLADTKIKELLRDLASEDD